MTSLLKPSINWLLIFIPITVMLEHAWPEAHTWIFFSACVAIVPIASLIVHATEQSLHGRVTPSAGCLTRPLATPPS